MNGVLGHAGIFLGLIGSIGAVVVGVRDLLFAHNGVEAGALERGKTKPVNASANFIWLMCSGVLLSVFAMEWALLNHDFSLQFVANNNSKETPLLFTIAGMWSALEGSILLWALILCGYIALAVRVFARRGHRQNLKGSTSDVTNDVVSWAIVISCLVAVFFFALMIGPADPFKATQGALPADGRGPNPLLQNHPLMAIHPPLLYLGYVGFTIPFAFAIASLITGRLDEKWLAVTRRWTLFAWMCLTVGILMGSWWSYEVLGWGGYWAWDPVENASLLPWLTATAYLHSVMVQERRAMLRVWNISLITATFSLTILGTFLTRSGVLDSVHAFSDSSIGPILLMFFAVIVVATCGLIFWRSSLLRAPGSLRSPLSREAAFLANNAIFAALAFVVLLGTVFPLIAEAIGGERVAVGRPFFDAMLRPLGMVLLALMTLGTAVSWRGTTKRVLADRLIAPVIVGAVVVFIATLLGAHGIWVFVGLFLASVLIASSLRTIAQLLIANTKTTSTASGIVNAIFNRRTGAMVAHIGLAVFAIGVIASSSATVRKELTMRPGEIAHVGGHSVRLVGLREVNFANRQSTFADISVDDRKTYSPALSRYANASQAIGTPSVATSFTHDVYLTLVRVPESTQDPVVLSVIVMPLVGWLWAAGGIIAGGVVLILFARKSASTHIDVREHATAEPQRTITPDEVVND